ncbi:phytoene desaturase family protein [Nocardioides sp. Soil805]|uniref:phytoene desaturase family protein n=1 Tax=Nocardioides sp. Soil805 TaxID=1736416 RepID=UPI00070320B4|nr:FAD-dependent oxidoreductase [Nocardioides sp. Soil805]KRF36245.1 UDP-galactopyranose mutase [Nocardioides sp. Soil805]
MARVVVVVGGGFGGLASAARLAKLGHKVTLVERSPSLGGALSSVSTDEGFGWDAGPTSTLLPAVVRDLFRKTGRPLEREPGDVDLVARDLVREHRFEDGSVLRLPGGSRSAQLAAFDALGPGLGEQWVAHVASYSDAWDLLRRDHLERPWDAALAPKALTDLLTGREVLHRRLRRTFRDERLRLVAGHPFVADGHDLRNVPAWQGVLAYVEQRFGSWTVPGGMARLGTVLAERLGTRGVTVLTGTTAHDLVVREGRVAAVATSAGELDADVVVCAVDPRRLPALAPHVARTMPAIPPVVCHLGLSDADALPDLPHEVVLHGDPMLVVRTGGRAPEGAAAWTVHGRGRLAEDLLLALARHRLDVRDRVVVRVDRSPRDLVDAWGGSPLGVLWQGRATVRARLGPTTPVPGVYAAGAHATPGSGLPFVGLSAALVAQAVGPA